MSIIEPEKYGVRKSTEEIGKGLLGLVFAEPKTIELGLKVVSNIYIYLNMFFSREDINGKTWMFSQLIGHFVHYDSDLWDTICLCVHDSRGNNLYGVPFKDLRTKGVIEAIEVFCTGIYEIEVPDMMKYYNHGITEEGIISFIQELGRMNTMIENNTDPDKILTTVVKNFIVSSYRKYGGTV